MDFRKKLLILAASGMAFAGVAAAQQPCTGATNSTGLPNLLRLEGTSDLATDLVIKCTGSTLGAGNVVVQLTGTITSKAQAGGTSEATLQINVGGVITTYAGTVSGSQISFGGAGGVLFPSAVAHTAYSITVSNVRINSSLLTSGVYVTEALNVYNQGVVAFSSANNTAPPAGLIPVGFTQQGFSIPSLGTGGLALAGPYQLCKANTTASFTVNLSEKFGGAFKTQAPRVNTIGGGAETCAGAPCTVTNGEQGSYVPGAGSTVGTANSGTRFQFSFAGVPTGVTVYLPITVGSNATVGNPVVFTLSSGSATGAFAAATSAAAPYVGYAAVPVANGAGTAIYEVTASDNTVPNESGVITGILAFAANFASTPPAAPTVTVTPAPTGSTNVPNFAASSNSALTLNSFTSCVTSLLFPFVTNQLGFDTGIVLANTSTDPYGAVGASPAPGACALNFYGAGAPTPNTGVAAPGGSQASGTTNAFQLSSVAPGFQGYVIAVCNYLYGHGYAFIEYNLTQGNGVAEGYLALVISGTRGQAAATETLTN